MTHENGHRPAVVLVTLSEAARELGVDYETVRRWVRKGAVPALEVGPAGSTSLRIARDELERLKRPYQPPE